jgi:hypothetical protein
MEGDVDNIVKLTLDGMARLVYLDDAQIERVVVQKFEPGRVVAFAKPSAPMGIVRGSAASRTKPGTRLSPRPFRSFKLNGRP